TLPVGGRAAIDAMRMGLAPTALSAPEVFSELVDAGERDRQIRRLNSYGAAEWLNREATERGGVILFEDVHGFYIDRPYLWGNGEHSTYIPYNQMKSGHDLTAWLRDHGIVYALFNLNFAPMDEGRQLPEDPDAVANI